MSALALEAMEVQLIRKVGLQCTELFVLRSGCSGNVVLEPPVLSESASAQLHLTQLSVGVLATCSTLALVPASSPPVLRLRPLVCRPPVAFQPLRLLHPLAPLKTA